MPPSVNQQRCRGTSFVTPIAKGEFRSLIFGVSVGFIALFVIGTIVFKSKARDFFSAIAGWLLENFNWMYVGGVSIVFLFLIGLFVSHFGRMRLGGDGEQPEHSTVSWFAMLLPAELVLC